MRKRFRASIVVVLAFVAVVPAARTATDEGPPRSRFLSPHGQDVETFQLAGNPRGDAAVAWTEFTGRGRHTRVWLRDRRHGQPFGLPSALTSSHVTSASPTVALGEDGSQVVAWFELRHGHRQLVAIARRAYGQFSERKVLARGADPDEGLALAVAPDGTALAAWTKGPRRSGLRQLYAAVRRADGGWSHSHRVTHGGRTVGSPRVAFDAAGNATLAWERRYLRRRYVDDLGTNGRPTQVAVAVRPAGGPFGRPHVVSKRSQDAGEPVLAENARGDAVIAWDSFAGGEFAIRVGCVTRRAGEGFGKGRLLTDRRGFAVLPQAAVDAEGRVTVGWTEVARRNGVPCERCQAVRTARGRAGEALSHARRVSGRRAQLQALAASPSGAELLVWGVDRGRSMIRSRLEGRFVTPRGELGPRRPLARAGVNSDVQALLPANGDGLVAWLLERGDENRILFAHSHK